MLLFRTQSTCTPEEGNGAGPWCCKAFRCLSLSPLPSSTSHLPFLSLTSLSSTTVWVFSTGQEKNDSCQHLQLTYSFIFPAKNKTVFPSASVPGTSAHWLSYGHMITHWANYWCLRYRVQWSARPEPYANLIGQICYQKERDAKPCQIFFFFPVATLLKHAYLYPQSPRTSSHDSKGMDIWWELSKLEDFL